jgi:hypothetical protein
MVPCEELPLVFDVHRLWLDRSVRNREDVPAIDRPLSGNRSRDVGRNLLDPDVHLHRHIGLTRGSGVGCSTSRSGVGCVTSHEKPDTSGGETDQDEHDQQIDHVDEPEQPAVLVDNGSHGHCLRVYAVCI